MVVCFHIHIQIFVQTIVLAWLFVSYFVFALATVVSCGLKFKLDGAKITNEFWAVHVDMALVKTKDMVWIHKKCNTR